MSLQLLRIALYLYDPPLSRLTGVTCGPVSQTRVCEPPSQGDSSTWTAPELTRSWSENRPAQVSPPGQAGRNQAPNVGDIPPTQSTLAPPLTGLTCGLQVIEGLHRAGVEFGSLSEDFDTSMANGRLQLSMMLAFSEWWRNSIRERAVAG